MKYFQNRQNPLTHFSEEIIELAFSKVAEYFGHSWLRSKDGSHVLQTLWNRKDSLSTNELYTFGSAIIAAENLAKQWLKHQIGLVKGKDKNNQKGAIFEILAVGYTAPNHVVTPAKPSQSGYDLDIETKQHTKYRTSMEYVKGSNL